MTIEIVDFPIKNGDFPQLLVMTRGYDSKGTDVRETAACGEPQKPFAALGSESQPQPDPVGPALKRSSQMVGYKVPQKGDIVNDPGSL